MHLFGLGDSSDLLPTESFDDFLHIRKASFAEFDPTLSWSWAVLLIISGEHSVTEVVLLAFSPTSSAEVFRRNRLGRVLRGNLRFSLFVSSGFLPLQEYLRKPLDQSFKFFTKTFNVLHVEFELFLLGDQVIEGFLLLFILRPALHTTISKGKIAIAQLENCVGVAADKNTTIPAIVLIRNWQKKTLSNNDTKMTT